MQLLFVGDGPRDEVVIPPIVAKVAPDARKGGFRAWKSIRLNRGSGYGRRLLFATREARDKGLDGVVAVVDRDRSKKGKRLSELQAARDADRKDALVIPLPVALGEADPHTEAWLLDDEKAVRIVLNLSQDVTVPNVGKCADPKKTLHDLAKEHATDEKEMSILAELASELAPKRCNHASETGLEGFLDDVKAEIAQ